MGNGEGRTIRRLGSGDGTVYRQIRLEALKTAPEALGTTYETAVMKDQAHFEDQIARACVFGAFSNDRIVGMAGFYREAGDKFEHKGVLWGMFVHPTHRNVGVGEDLVGAVLEHAKSRVDLVTLAVVTENASAVALYLKTGFRAYGVEERALKYQGRYLSETLMVCDLN